MQKCNSFQGQLCCYAPTSILEHSKSSLHRAAGDYYFHCFAQMQFAMNACHHHHQTSCHHFYRPKASIKTTRDQPNGTFSLVRKRLAFFQTVALPKRYFQRNPRFLYLRQLKKKSWERGREICEPYIFFGKHVMSLTVWHFSWDRYDLHFLCQRRSNISQGLTSCCL